MARKVLKDTPEPAADPAEMNRSICTSMKQTLPRLDIYLIRYTGF